MVNKSPELDSFIITKGSSVELSVGFSSRGPAKAQVFINDTQSYSENNLHPSRTDFSFIFSMEEPGEYEVDISVDATGPISTLPTEDGGTEILGKEDIANVTWLIDVADPEELHKSNSQRFIQYAKDIAAIGGACDLSWRTIQHIKSRFEELPKETQKEITTLSDFTEENKIDD